MAYIAPIAPRKLSWQRKLFRWGCAEPRRHLISTVEEFLPDLAGLPYYNIEAYSVGKLVRDTGIPYLHLESDYSSSDLESLKVRIEAMLEMVEK